MSGHERLAAHHFQDGAEVRVRGFLGQGSDTAHDLARTERDLDPRAHFNLRGHLGRNEVIKLFAERNFQSDACYHRGLA